MDPSAQQLQSQINTLNANYLALQNVVYSHKHKGYDYTLQLESDIKSSTLVDAANIVVDATTGSYFTVTLGGNRTLMNPTGAKNGQRFLFEIIQDGTGSRTLAYDTKFAFGVTLPSITLTTTAGATDYIGAVYSETADKFYILAFSPDY